MTTNEYRPGTLRLSEIPDCLNKAIVESGKTRWHIAAEMSQLTGEHVTKMMLDAWTAPSKPKARFPFEFAAAFQVATNSRCLEEILVTACGRTIMEPAQVLEATLGQLQCQEERIKRQKEAILAQMGGEDKKNDTRKK
ncbi:MAG: hypothetical protein HQL99_15340 [Magnetococcales bacterium]|nr:hypothetical protein [Magnetococcales bacterium]